jgi:hypothetical protein
LTPYLPAPSGKVPGKHKPETAFQHIPEKSSYRPLITARIISEDFNHPEHFALLQTIA